MDWNVIGSHALTVVVTLLTSGGVVMRYYEIKERRREAAEKLAVEAETETSQAQILDRQKLTDDVYKLYQEAVDAERVLRAEQIQYERRISMLEREKEKLERELYDARQFTEEQHSEIVIKISRIERLERELAECRRTSLAQVMRE
jgi:predicted RNase H-like nuclease (RuvC/YqgF family)